MTKTCVFLHYNICLLLSDVYDLCAVVGSEWHYCLQELSGFQENAREYKIPQNCVLHSFFFLITGAYLYLNICYCRNKWRKHFQQQVNWTNLTESSLNFEVRIESFPASLWYFVYNHRLLHILTLFVVSFRQEDEAERPEKGPHKITVTPEVLAKILRWAFELRPTSLSVHRPHSVLPPKRPGSAARIFQEQVG